VVKVVPHVSEIDAGLHAPTKIPKDIKMIKEEAPPPPSSMGVAGMSGMSGGSPGGVFGGIAGGTGHGPAIHVAPPKSTAPARISAGVIAGNRIAFVEPQYPPIAKIAHMSGTVVLRAIISKSGTIEQLSVANSTNPMFNNYAMEAVKQWRYKPYLLNNEPTEVDTTITVNFALNAGG
jgi:protein TonB